MIDSNTKFTATILTVSILAACGGGNSGTTSSQNTTTGTTGTTEKSYNSFVKSGSTFEVTGFEVNTDYEDGTTKLIEVNETGVANVQAKTITFTNEYGDISFITIGATGTDTINGNKVTYFAANDKYEYVNGLSIAYEASTQSGLIAYGVETKTADLPTTGSATYTGDAEAYVVFNKDPGNDYHSLENGKSNVAVDFGKGTVDATLNGFTVSGVNPENHNYEIELTDMKIEGNGFGGGEFVITDNGTDLDLGQNPTGKSWGHFYGYDNDKNIPDEVGGIFAVSAANGTSVQAGFIAD